MTQLPVKRLDRETIAAPQGELMYSVVSSLLGIVELLLLRYGTWGLAQKDVAWDTMGHGQSNNPLVAPKASRHLNGSRG
jgi:hypothetical protein